MSIVFVPTWYSKFMDMYFLHLKSVYLFTEKLYRRYLQLAANETIDIIALKYFAQWKIDLTFVCLHKKTLWKYSVFGYTSGVLTFFGRKLIFRKINKKMSIFGLLTNLCQQKKKSVSALKVFNDPIGNLRRWMYM